MNTPVPNPATGRAGPVTPFAQSMTRNGELSRSAGYGRCRIVRKLLVNVLFSVPLVASATDSPLSVPNDAAAKYFLLERHGSALSATLLMRRVGRSGVTYFQSHFDCLKHTVTYDGGGDSLEAVRRSTSGPFRVPIVEKSVDHDLWIEACAGRTSEQKHMAERMAGDEKRMKLEWRIQEIRPHRREGPLRSRNIDDKEIREILSVAADILPGAIVNIGGVVSGCPCEDGLSCSAQVWIVAHRAAKTNGLLLSRISNQWQVGPVQQWWLDYEVLRAGRSRPSIEEGDALTDRFPGCAAQSVVPGGAAAGRTRP